MVEKESLLCACFVKHVVIPVGFDVQKTTNIPDKDERFQQIVSHKTASCYFYHLYLAVCKSRYFLCYPKVISSTTYCDKRFIVLKDYLSRHPKMKATTRLTTQRQLSFWWSWENCFLFSYCSLGSKFKALLFMFRLDINDTIFVQYRQCVTNFFVGLHES